MNSESLVLTNARVWDGKSAAAVPGATVVIDAGSITSVDARVHLTMDTLCGKNIIWHHLALHPSLRAYHALANAQKALNAGFTTLRTMQAGGPDMGGDAALHDAIEQGIMVGPRIIPSAMIFGMTGGHNDMFVPAVFKERWATAD